MSQAGRQRAEIEGIIREWLRVSSPEDRAAEGAKLVAFLAARLAFWCDRPTTIMLFYEMGDTLVGMAPPDRCAP